MVAMIVDGEIKPNRSEVLSFEFATQLVPISKPDEDSNGQGFKVMFNQNKKFIFLSAFGDKSCFPRDTRLIIQNKQGSSSVTVTEYDENFTISFGSKARCPEPEDIWLAEPEKIVAKCQFAKPHSTATRIFHWDSGGDIDLSRSHSSNPDIFCTPSQKSHRIDYYNRLSPPERKQVKRANELETIKRWL